MEEEATKIFNAFKIEVTSEDTLHYYMFFLQNPEAKTSKVFKRITEYNEERDRSNYLAAMDSNLNADAVLR